MFTTNLLLFLLFLTMLGTVPSLQDIARAIRELKNTLELKK